MTAHPQPSADHVSVQPRQPSRGGHRTHEIENMPPELPDQNLFLGDRPLMEAFRDQGIDWIAERADRVGRLTGSRRIRDLARMANEYTPVQKTHDRVGQRIDFVEYHPSYHELMGEVYGSEVHSVCWQTNEARPLTARSVLSYLWNQAENGTQCPSTMSFSVVPLLRSDPEIGDRWLSGILSRDYDPRPIGGDQKAGITVAMSMTEKQGGSDLRTNDTTAVPTGNEREYLLTGHKFFCSAPMGDIVLLTAKTEQGVTLFVAPRTLPDGSRNNIRIQRLKDKLGNRSNASSEIELDNTIAYRIGEDGHGIRQFIKHMTHYIRMDFAMASAGLLRQCLTLALHHTGSRSAFGSTIRDLPQMRNALADLAIESEAAMLLGLRVARATDDAAEDGGEDLLSRVLVPIAKYWTCRRACHVALEALECHGGMGYVEEQAVARLYREAPLNSVWEGTSAMMGLDVIRALQRHPEAKDALLREIRLAGSGNRHLDAYADKVERELNDCSDMLEPHARRLMSMIAQAVQGSLLVRQSPQEVADIYCASRLGGEWAHEFGTLRETGPSLDRIVDRAAISH